MNTTDWWLPSYTYRREDCPNRPHRAPEGPNEDMGNCPECGALSWELRPEGETYGDHRADCALPLRHPSYCVPGGNGHPRAPKIRGYWPGTEDNS